MIQARLHHIGVAVRDLETTVTLYEERFGIHFEPVCEVLPQKVRVAFCNLGDAAIELVQATARTSPHIPMLPHPIISHIAKRGEGIHHLCFSVSDLDEAIERLRATGMSTVTDEPQTGSDGARIIFVNPVNTLGTLIELYEDPAW